MIRIKTSLSYSLITLIIQPFAYKLAATSRRAHTSIKKTIQSSRQLTEVVRFIRLRSREQLPLFTNVQYFIVSWIGFRFLDFCEPLPFL